MTLLSRVGAGAASRSVMHLGRIKARRVTGQLGAGATPHSVMRMGRIKGRDVSTHGSSQ